MGFNFHTIQVLLTAVGGLFGIALELLLLHTLLQVKLWFDARAYSNLLQASVDYAEEWTHQKHLAHHTITGDDKLCAALRYVESRKAYTDSAQLRLDIHAELGRRRGLRVTALVGKFPPPIPKG